MLNAVLLLVVLTSIGGPLLTQFFGRRLIGASAVPAVPVAVDLPHLWPAAEPARRRA